MTDPIADYLTRIKNGYRAKHKKTDIPSSKIKLEMTKILLKEKYIQGFTKIEDGRQGLIRVYLKYDDNDESVITDIKRISKPGLRQYVKKTEIPRVINNLGIAILSTPLGVVSNKEAKQKGVGGEVLCYIW